MSNVNMLGIPYRRAGFLSSAVNAGLQDWGCLSGADLRGANFSKGLW